MTWHLVRVKAVNWSVKRELTIQEFGRNSGLFFDTPLRANYAMIKA